MVWMIISILTAVCTLLALINGLWGVHAIDFSIELVTGKSTNFELGISNELFNNDYDNSVEQEFRIGLLFVSFVIVFIKFKA